MRTKMARRLQDIAKGACQAPEKRDTLRIEQALLTAETKLDTVRTIIESLASKHEHLSEVLGRVLTLTDDVITY